MDDLEVKNSIRELEEIKCQHEKSRNYEAALDVCQQICDLLIDTKGADDIETLEYHVQLAFCYSNVHKHNMAKSVMWNVYLRKCELFGENAPTTIKTQCAHLRLFNSNDDETLELDEKAYEKIGLIYDTDDIDVMCAMYYYAHFLDSFYGYSAITPYEQIRDWTLKFRGKGSQEHLDILSELADIYYEHEFYDKAIEIGKEYYEHSCSKYGSEGKLTLLILENLAKVYFFYDKFGEALLRLTMLSEIYERNGEKADKKVETYCNIAMCFYKKGDIKRARVNAKKAYDLCVDSDIENSQLVESAKDLFAKINDNTIHKCIFLRWQYIYGKLV